MLKDMKITIEIPNDLFKEAKNYASTRGLTFKQVVKTGLRMVLDANRTSPRPFRLKVRPFKGHGLVEDLDWNALRERIYEGRGGREK
jgi:hypothetical protein